MPKVQFRYPTVGVKAGDVVEVDAATAKRLLDGGHAVKVKETKSEKD
jgi:hypothetical protein